MLAGETGSDTRRVVQRPYLLLRVERFEGIVVLVGNFVHNVGSALQRRLAVVAEFRGPAAPSCGCCVMRPSARSVVDGVDRDELDERSELTGSADLPRRPSRRASSRRRYRRADDDRDRACSKSPRGCARAGDCSAPDPASGGSPGGARLTGSSTQRRACRYTEAGVPLEGGHERSTLTQRWQLSAPRSRPRLRWSTRRAAR